LTTLEEYAIEASIAKVAGSEMLNFVLDENIQIHGGNGFVRDYPAERHYRDSRVNRIFEGTNEINRLLITGMLVKRAMQGRLPLVAAAQAVAGEMLAGPAGGELEGDGTPLAAEKKLTANAKKIALFAAGVAYQRFRGDLENQQEVLAGLSDIIMETYAMESAVLRTAKLAAAGRGTHALDVTAVFTQDAMGRIEASARTVLAACQEGDTLRTSLAFLRRLTRREPVDTVALRRHIAARLIEAEKYLSS
jgi:butyryl-CoA dehydrogenase